MKAIYLAIAYRWGWTNAHSYFVFIGREKRRVILEAESECHGRGGKYGVEVIKFIAQNGHHEHVAYFPSAYQEDKPHHNNRIDLFEHVGMDIITHFDHKKRVLSKTAILKSIRKAKRHEKLMAELNKRIEEGKKKCSKKQQ